MNWIEKVFGTSSDDDSGLNKFLLFLVPIPVALAALVPFRKRQQSKPPK